MESLSATGLVHTEVHKSRPAPSTRFCCVLQGSQGTEGTAGPQVQGRSPELLNRSDSPLSCGRGGGTRLLRTWTQGSFWPVFRKGTVSPQAHAWARCYRFCGQWPWLCSDDAQPPAVAQHTPHSTAAQKHVSSKVRPVAMAEVAAPPTLFPLRPCCCVPGTKQAPGRCSTVHPSLPHPVYRGRGTLQNVCPYRRWPERPASGDEAALAVGGSGGTARPSPVHRRGKARPVPSLRR